jgi:hypothetical protein
MPAPQDRPTLRSRVAQAAANDARMLSVDIKFRHDFSVDDFPALEEAAANRP